MVWYAFALELLFTALTLGAGFQGGEVTPLFVAVFAAATNTPLACTIMGLELFGVEALPYLAVGCVVAYVFSAHWGIYGAQRIDTPRPRWAGTTRPARRSAMRLGVDLDIDIDRSRGARYGSERPFLVPSAPVHAPS